MYPAAGGSDDFAMSKGIELSLTIELPPEDEFEGFKISSKKIKTVCSETMIVTREFALFLADNYWCIKIVCVIAISFPINDRVVNLFLNK